MTPPHPSDGRENWRERGEQTVDHKRGKGWRESRRETDERLWERGGNRGGRGMRGAHHFEHHHPHFSDNFGGGGPPNIRHPPRQSGFRSRHNRGRYQLAPR